MKSRRAAESGLSLVEVMVATAITAVVAMVAAQLMVSGMKGAKSSQDMMAIRELASEVGAVLSTSAACTQAFSYSGNPNMVNTQLNSSSAPPAPLPIALQIGDPKKVTPTLIPTPQTASCAPNCLYGGQFNVTQAQIALISSLGTPPWLPSNSPFAAYQGRITLTANGSLASNKAAGGGAAQAQASQINIPIVVAALPNQVSTPIQYCYTGMYSPAIAGSNLVSKGGAISLDVRSYQLSVGAGESGAVVCPAGTALIYAVASPPGSNLLVPFYPAQPQCLTNLGVSVCNLQKMDHYYTPTGANPGEASIASTNDANQWPRGCLLNGNDVGVNCQVTCLVMTTPTT